MTDSDRLDEMISAVEGLVVEARDALDELRIRKRLSNQEANYLPKVRPPKSGGVYFLASTCPPGLIKIGWARNIKKRLSQLQCGSPHPIRLVAVMRGATRLDEGAMHRLYAKRRYRGEWFWLCPEMAEQIMDLSR